MIRDNEAVDAGLHRAIGIFGGQNTFKNQWKTGGGAQPIDVLPRETFVHSAPFEIRRIPWKLHLGSSLAVARPRHWCVNGYT